MSTSKDSKEPKSEVNWGFFPTNVRNPIHNVSQLFPNSCVPFSMAQLFTKIMHENTPDFRGKDLTIPLRIFEIGIYPEIWKEADSDSDEEKSVKYMKQFLKNLPEVYTDAKQIADLKPKANAIFFMVEKKGNQSHNVLVLEENNEFLCEGKRYKNLSEMKKNIEKIFIIKQEDLDVQLIRVAFEKYQNILKNVLVSYNENNSLDSLNSLSTFYLSGLTSELPQIYESDLLNVYVNRHEFFPGFSSIIEKELMEQPSKHIKNLKEMENIITHFPPCRESMKQLFSAEPATYLENLDQIKIAIKIFPETQQDIEDLVQKNPSKYLKSSADLQEAIKLFPNIKEIPESFQPGM